ncbi:MAG: fibronectin type III domain-containing protein [Sphaerochaetaceae bacterium]|nr:fibronectin type III domain-containing protein [Sphaerochaetaceae bacterium]
MFTKLSRNVKKKLPALLGVTICCLSLFISCPMAPPEDPMGGFNPYLAPSSPTNVSATNGVPNKIALQWDASENATSYQVWMLKSDDYGAANTSRSTTLSYSNLQERGFKFVEDVTATKYELSNQTAGSAYIFAIVAMRDLGSSVTAVGRRVLYSNPSALFEGSTVGGITLSAVATSQTIALYWDVPNIFKTIPSVPGVDEPLYDYSFTLEYKLKSAADVSANWTSVSGVGKNFHHELNIASNGLSVDTTYEFRISMTVLDENGMEVTTVQSIRLPVTTETNMLPDKIESINITSGSLADGVKLTWIAPKIPSGLDVTNVFRIDRKVDGDESAVWETVLAASKDSGIQKGSDEREYFWMDTTVADNVKYVYRILNGYINASDVITLQDEADATKSSVGWKLWLPTDVQAAFAPGEGTNPDNGTVALSWNYSGGITDGITWKLKTSVWSQKDGTTESKTEDIVPIVSSDVYSYNSNIHIAETNFVHTFEFVLEFLFNGEVVKSLPVSTTPGTVSLGMSSSAVLFSNFTATQNLVGKIRLSWIVIDGLTEESYEIWGDGNKLADVPVPTESGNTRTVELTTSGTHVYRLTAKANYGGESQTYYGPDQITGSTLAVPRNLVASDGTSLTQIDITWDSPANNDDGAVKYELWYKLDSSDDTGWQSIDISSLLVSTTTITDGAGTDRAGEIYDFRMRAYNTTQSVGGENSYTEWTELEKGSIFGPGNMTLSATQGTDPRKVQLTWNAVEGASSYTIYRNSVRVKGNHTSTSYADEELAALVSTVDNPTPLSEKYTYKVVPVPVFEADINALRGKEAQGWLFGPPKNIVASKGAAVGVINVTWDAVDGADSYIVQKYTIDTNNEHISQGSPITVTTNSLNDSTSTNPVYYTVLAHSATGMESAYQNGFGTTASMFKEKEADNYGYRLTTPSTFFVTEQVDASNAYRPYVRLTWDRVAGATHYTVKALDGTTVIDVSGLNYHETNAVDNGVPSTSAGYLQYDPSKKQYVYNDDTGILTNSLIIVSYKLNAVNNVSSASTGYLEDATNVRRALKAPEAVNLVNGSLYPLLHRADAAFGGDWFQYTTSTIQYTDDAGAVITAANTFWNPAGHYYGNIVLDGFGSAINGIVLSTTASLRTDTGSGVGTSALISLSDDSNGVIVARFGTGYNDVKIKYCNIRVPAAVEGAGHCYIVTLGTASEITVPDSSSIVRPF